MSYRNSYNNNNRPPPSPSSDLSSFLSGMSHKARAAASVSSSLLSSASSRIAANAPAQVTNVREYWAGWLTGRRSPENSRKYVVLQPGWAVKRLRTRGNSSQASDGSFDIEMFLHGFCGAERDSSTVSRTRRAFISLAKRFAALPSAPTSSGSSSTSGSSSPTSPTVSDNYFATQAALSAALANLDARLLPFWSSSVPNQPLKVRVFLNDPNGPEHSTAHPHINPRVLHETEILTADDGQFHEKICIPWRDIQALGSEEDGKISGLEQLSNVGPNGAVNLRLTVELADLDLPAERGLFGQTAHEDEQKELPVLSPDSNDRDTKTADNSVLVRVSEPSGIRVLSDIDDTIKHSDILAGPREVFRNVFCRPVEDLAVEGMSKLFRDLADVGINGFHYVSNSPVELLASLTDFLKAHDFPGHFSLNLKLYGSRSLLTSLWEPSADRKRSVVLGLFESFPTSKFLLFGDSGEQDLELYLWIAQQRPGQVLGIFIRDVTSGRADQIRKSSLNRAPSIPTPTRGNSYSSDSSRTQYTESLTTEPSVLEGHDPDSEEGKALADLYEGKDLTSAQQKVLRRASLWDERVASTRLLLPREVPLMLFTDPVSIEKTAIELAQKAKAEGKR